MASIYTGLAFMHGHIVDRELVLRLGREQPSAQPGADAAMRPAKPGAIERRLPLPRATPEPCASCC